MTSAGACRTSSPGQSPEERQPFSVVSPSAPIGRRSSTLTQQSSEPATNRPSTSPDRYVVVEFEQDSEALQPSLSRNASRPPSTAPRHHSASSTPAERSIAQRHLIDTIPTTCVSRSILWISRMISIDVVFRACRLALVVKRQRSLSCAKHRCPSTRCSTARTAPVDRTSTSRTP